MACLRKKSYTNYDFFHAIKGRIVHRQKQPESLSVFFLMNCLKKSYTIQKQYVKENSKQV